MTISLLSAGAGEEHFRRAARFLDPIRVLAGEHHPFHLDLRMGLGQVQNCAAGADLDVVAVSAKAKQTLDARQIQNW